MRTRHGECDVRRAVPEVARITSGYRFLKLALPHTTFVFASEALASPCKLSLVELVNPMFTHSHSMPVPWQPLSGCYQRVWRLASTISCWQSEGAC